MRRVFPLGRLYLTPCQSLSCCVRLVYSSDAFRRNNLFPRTYTYTWSYPITLAIALRFEIESLSAFERSCLKFTLLYTGFASHSNLAYIILSFPSLSLHLYTTTPYSPEISAFFSFFIINVFTCSVAVVLFRVSRFLITIKGHVSAYSLAVCYTFLVYIFTIAGLLRFECVSL